MTTKELLEARHSTPLEIEFEKSMSGGIKQVKERIRLANEAIVNRSKQAEAMEEEKEKLEKGYEAAVDTQQELCRRIRESELKLEFIEREIEEVEKKLYQKEEFLRELLSFDAGESIGRAKEVELILKDKKRTYMANHTKLDKAQERKLVLDSQQQMVEKRSNASKEKMKELKYKLFQLNEEQKRQEKEWIVSKERAKSTSSESEKRESEFDDVTKRIEFAKLKVDLLKVDISNREKELADLTRERKGSEDYLKRFFASAMQQVDMINT